MDLHSVIIRPIVTEKTARLQDDTVRKYTLEVSSIATDLKKRAKEIPGSVIVRDRRSTAQDRDKDKAR